MESVRSLLIRSCMSQIQKELGHLEHWLLRLPEDTVATSATVATNVAATAATSSLSSDLLQISTTMAQLSKQMEAQQSVLQLMAERIEVLESVKEVHITTETEPWTDDTTTPYVHDDNESDISDLDTTVYLVCKREPSSDEKEAVADAEATVVAVTEVVTVAVEAVEVVEAVAVEAVAVEAVEVVQEAIAEAVEVVPTVPVVEEVVEEAIVEAVEVVPTVPVVEEVVQEVIAEAVEVVQEVEVEEVEEEEVEQEEEVEEEDGVELEEFTHQGVTYYRDPDMLLYTADEEGQPSEEPIGYWKEKSKTIAFYKKK